MNQYSNRGGARNGPGQRNNTASPVNVHHQQQQNVMGSSMPSPGSYQNYGPPHMYTPYGGFPQHFSGYAGQNYQQQHQQQQNYVNQGGRPASNFTQQNSYQNPALQAPTTSTMSRSGSAMSERPASTMIASSAPSTAGPPAFQTPARKKGSSAIKIVNPNTKQDIILPPKAPGTAEQKREATASPAPPKIERPVSSGPPRPHSSASQVTTETPDQKKAKQEAVKQAVLDKIAATKAEEDRKVEDDKAAQLKIDAAAAREAEEKERADKAAQEAQEQARLAAEQAAQEEAKAVAERKAKEDAERERIEAEEKKRIVQEEASAKAAALKAQEDADAAVAALKAQQDADAAVAAEKVASEKKKAEADADAKAQEESDRLEKLKTDQQKVAEEQRDTEESKQLTTIAETAAANQKADVIETKPVEEQGHDSTSDVKTTENEAPKPATEKKRPSNLNLESNTSVDKALPSAMMTSLRTSRHISNISLVTYPVGIKAPDATINKNAKDGRIKYDKDFLLQFQRVYTDKPNSDWDERIKVAMGDSDSKSGKSTMGPRSTSNRANGSPFGLATFNSKPLKSSEDRFKQAEKMRAAGIDPAAALAGSASTYDSRSSYKPTISRKDSLSTNSPRTDSKRGGKGGTGSASVGGRASSNRPDKNQIGAATIAPEDVKPLANSGNRWTPKRAAEAEPLPGLASNTMAPDLVQRKVKGLLNKLTLDNFDKITDQILEIASQSKEENDGRTLRQVIALTFEKATDEAHFSNMYARFCRKTMECTSDEVKDEGILDKHGQQVVGGALFRKYLLSRCQEDFERGWKTDLPPKPEGEAESAEAVMLSDEYYIAAAAKRRGLGLVKFVGELFLLQMLNEKIMQECIRRLLANVTDPEEEEVESLSKLVETVGSALDSTQRGQEIMDVYMGRMEQLTKCDSLSSRIKFMVLDVIDLRKNRWAGSKRDKGPKTIQEIHDEAAKAAALKESQRGNSQRGGPGQSSGRPDLGRGDVRNMSRRQESHGPNLTTTADGWSMKTREPQARAGDLTKFGRFETRAGSRQTAYGPGGNLSQTTITNSAQASRNPSHSAAQSREDSRSSQVPSNIFAALEGDTGNPDAPEEPEPEVSTGRPRLNLLPKGAAANLLSAKEEQNETEAVSDEKENPKTTRSEETEDQPIPMPGDE